MGHIVSTAGTEQCRRSSGGDLAIDLFQSQGQQRRFVGIVLAGGDPTALTPNPAGANIEQLHRNLEFIGHQGPQIRINFVAQHRGVLFLDFLQGLELVAQFRGVLEPELRGGLPHLGFELAAQSRLVSRHHLADLVSQLEILGVRDATDAGRGAAPDVALEAGALLGESSGKHRVGTGSKRQHSFE